MPSVQIELQLWITKASDPIAASALRTPPPELRSASRSSEIVISGRVRPARWAMSVIGKMVDVDDGAPDAGRIQPIEDVVDQRLSRDAHEGLWQLQR